MTREFALEDALRGLIGWIEDGCPEDGAAFVIHEAKSLIEGRFRFSEGDEVVHMSRGRGIVRAVGEFVHVEFEDRPGKISGIYDANWFLKYPDGLIKRAIAPTEAAQGDRK